MEDVLLLSQQRLLFSLSSMCIISMTTVVHILSVGVLVDVVRTFPYSLKFSHSIKSHLPVRKDDSTWCSSKAPQSRQVSQRIPKPLGRYLTPPPCSLNIPLFPLQMLPQH